MREITPDELRTLLRYEPETGKLFWLPRDISQFEDTEKKTAQQICNWWNSRFAGEEAFCANGVYGCKSGRIFGEVHYAHHVAWAIHHGRFPVKQIDHIDGDRANNAANNLREVTFAENMRNRKLPKHNTSGTMGVSFNKRMGRWQAHITEFGQRRHLGTFDRKQEAVAARIEAQRTSGAFHANHGRL